MSAGDWVWMRHPGGTDPARFPSDAVEFWQARGWEPTEPPTEPDPTAEPRRPTAVPATEPATDTEPVATTNKANVGRQRRAETEETS